MKRCAKGHYFDAVKYAACPYCANKRDEDDKTIAVLPDEIEVMGDITQAGEPGELFVDEEVTEAMDPTQVHAGSMPSDIFSEEDENIFIESAPKDDDYKAEDEDEGKTIGVFNMKKVVGWLVCTEGSEKGKDFVLQSGSNFIGRSPSMDVVLSEDREISKEKHAIITYDPKKASFHLSYGTGHGLVYLNGEEVLAPVKLEAYDQIELGKTLLIFVPFCSESFKWEEER